MDGYKRLFYTHRRYLLVSIYSVEVGKGFGWMDSKYYFIHIGEIY